MCGRYSITTPLEAMLRLFRLSGPLPNIQARYNVAPTQDAPVVRFSADAEERELAMLRWGLIPSWAKEARIGYKMINARAETVAQKPAFRNAFRHRRCLVPADGFYEWRKLGNDKQPYRITLADGGPFAFAGLWERWQGPDGEAVDSFTIITTEANPLLRPIHDRMPVIIDPAARDMWLNIGSEVAEAAQQLLRPYPAAAMMAYPVSRRVNKPSNDDEECINPTGEAVKIA